MGSEQMNDKKEVQTMWSESLLEHLYLALKKDKDDALLWEIIEELRAKDYDDDFLIKKVKQKVNTDAAVSRITNLLAGKTTGGSSAFGAGEEKPLSKADQARANAAKKRANEGIVGKIKGIFGGK